MAETRPIPEQRDVSPRWLTIFAAGLLAFIGLTLLGVALIFDTGGVWPVGGPAETGNSVSPALQVEPEEDFAQHRRREEASLHALGWVDRNAGIARIPIEDAMAIIAQRGLPNWGAAGAPETEECRLLSANVPRAPQARGCRDITGPRVNPPATDPEEARP